VEQTTLMLKCFVIISLVISLVCPALATSTKIYVWRNTTGLLAFSDRPHIGAEEAKLTRDSAVIPSMNINTSLLDIKPKELENEYEVVITQPKNSATLRDNNGTVYINATISPLFQPGFKIELYLDGKLYKRQQHRTIFSLENIDRGEHQIKMALINKEGKVIASSQLTTFYMHRTIAN